MEPLSLFNEPRGSFVEQALQACLAAQTAAGRVDRADTNWEFASSMAAAKSLSEHSPERAMVYSFAFPSLSEYESATTVSGIDVLDCLINVLPIEIHMAGSIYLGQPVVRYTSALRGVDELKGLSVDCADTGLAKRAQEVSDLLTEDIERRTLHRRIVRRKFSWLLEAFALLERGITVDEAMVQRYLEGIKPPSPSLRVVQPGYWEL